MTLFVDTDLWVDALRGRGEALRRRLEPVAPRSVRVPSIVQAELLLGAAKSSRPERSRRAVLALLDPFRIVSFDVEAARAYAGIRATLERDGNRIGANDLIVAATVVASGGTLLTGNRAEFSRIPGLSVESP